MSKSDEVRREYNPRGNNTIITYTDGSTWIESKNMCGDTQIVISKAGKEIATVIEKEWFMGNTEYKTTYKDGGSSKTVYNPNTLFGSENQTLYSEWGVNNKSYHEAISHHEEIINHNSKNNQSKSLTPSNTGNTDNHSSYEREYSDIYRNNTTSNKIIETRVIENNLWAKNEIKGILDNIPKEIWKPQLSIMVLENKLHPEVALEAIKKIREINNGEWLETRSIVYLVGTYDDRVRYEVFKDTKDMPMSGNWWDGNCDDLARHDPYPKIRLEALKRLDINDYQETFSFIASKEKDPEVQLEAIKRIKKPSLQEYQKMNHSVYRSIESIAKGTIYANREARKEALRKVINNEVLYDIAREDNDESFSLLALDQIEDEKYISRLLKLSKHRSIRKKCRDIINPWKSSYIKDLIEPIQFSINQALWTKF